MKPDSSSEGRLLFPGTTFVLGKGGVGKTVISEGLASLSEQAGHETLLVRLGESLLPPADRSFAPSPSAHGFHVVDLDPRTAMDEYVRHVVRVRALSDRIIASDVYAKFFAAAPGLPELVILGRIREYTREKDGEGTARFRSIVVDCPSSGHALLMLETPFAAFRAASIGPFGRLASGVTTWLGSETRLVVVAIPEEMAVVEAIEFQRDLRDRTGLGISLAILNRLRTEPISTETRRAVADRGGRAPALALADDWLLECGARVLRRNRLEAFHQRRMARGLALQPVKVAELDHPRPRQTAEALLAGA